MIVFFLIFIKNKEKVKFIDMGLPTKRKVYPKSQLVDAEGDVVSFTSIEIVTTSETPIDTKPVNYDETTGSNLNSILNPDYGQFTDSESLVTASDIGVADDTWIDQGAEFDCRAFSEVTFFVNFTQNTSTGNQIQVLSKHESDGADEYVLETSSDYQKTLFDGDIKIAYTFDVRSIPYIQLQSKAAVVSSSIGTLSVHVVKAY